MSEYEKTAVVTPSAPTGGRQPSNPISANPIIAQKIKKSATNFKTFTTDIFSQAKNLLDIRQVLEYYGVQLNSKNFALCPFHQERTPSFKAYDNTFHCFGCGVSGTVIDFAVKLTGLSGIDALRQLNSDFRLNLPIGAPQTKEEYQQLRLQAEKRENARNYVKDFEDWEQKTLSNLCMRFREMHDRSQIVLPLDDPHLWEHVAELAEMPFLEWLIDTMIENMRDFGKQVEFYNDFREVTARYEL